MFTTRKAQGGSQRPGTWRSGRLLVVAMMFAVSMPLTLLSAVGAAAASTTTFATVNGQGSTLAALAFQQWTQAMQVQGYNVNYTATGTPAGLQAYQDNTADFAGTEAEYSELYGDTKTSTPNGHVPRGFAYTPDVAGAVAIMYHVALNPTGSDPVDYLQLSRLTVARIFMGIINNWDSPTITADNKGLVLPNEAIRVYYRSGESGTTALFYDFVNHTDPTQYAAWTKSNNFPSTTRIWEVDDGVTFPSTNDVGYSGSTQQAQAVASPEGLWSISYDEFGYAKVYHDDVAWIENASGDWVQPYALNIAAALQTAVLAPDTSQTLINVYASTNPLAYPISAYSYIVYQCAPTPARPTCKTPYVNPGVENTMAKFMRYIACTGQIKMATIGYSPLPPQLSQFMANAIGYMTGQTPVILTVKNCANPQFQGGDLGVGALPPPNPVANVVSEAPPGSAGTSSTSGAASNGTGHSSSSKGSVAAATGSTTQGTTSATGVASTGAVAGVAAGATAKSTSGGTESWVSPDPVAYVGPQVGSTPPWPMLTLLLLLLIPAALLSRGWWRRRSAGRSGGDAGATDTAHEHSGAGL